MRIVWTMALLLAALPAQAQVYKCTEDGRTVYQDHPCASGGERIEAPPSPTAGPGAGTDADADAAAARAESLKRMRELAEEAERARKLREVDQAIARSRSRLQRLEADHRRELEALDKRLKSARGDFAQATPETLAREMSIDRERERAIRRYDENVKTENKRIEELEKQRAEMTE